jgi:hypothetical protein
VVEPEDAADASGAIVDGEFEELSGLELAGGDGADGFCAGKKGAFARKGDGFRGRMRRGWGEREKVEGHEFDVGIVESEAVVVVHERRTFFLLLPPYENQESTKLYRKQSPRP